MLSRPPYDKNGRRRPGDIDPFVEGGYVVIIQDTRGRFASDGSLISVWAGDRFVNGFGNADQVSDRDS